MQSIENNTILVWDKNQTGHSIYRRAFIRAIFDAWHRHLLLCPTNHEGHSTLGDWSNHHIGIACRHLDRTQSGGSAYQTLLDSSKRQRQIVFGSSLFWLTHATVLDYENA